MGKYSSYGSWADFRRSGSGPGRRYPPFVLVSFLVCLAAFLISQFFQNVPSYRSSLPPRLWPVVIRNYRVYLAVFLRHLGATAVWIILPLYLAGLGLNQFWIGFLWGINFVVKFIVMRCLQQFSAFKVFAFGQTILASWPLPSRLKVVPYSCECFTGVAWSCLHVGALDRPVWRKGVQQGVFSRRH